MGYVRLIEAVIILLERKKGGSRLEREVQYASDDLSAVRGLGLVDKATAGKR
jgi:hypothetical protein